jgi:hypothetical protein
MRSIRPASAKMRIPPLTAAFAAWQHPFRTNHREFFSRDMNRTFISKPTIAQPRVSCLWLGHADSGAMVGTVSGRTIG